MIPSSWRPHLREEDGELLGYLVPAEGSGQVVPVTVFGFPLAEALDPSGAADVLDRVGLSYLAERWLLTLDGREEPIAVTVVEASPELLRVQNADYGYEGNIGEVFTLPVPVPDRLRLA